jgi:hypothetical protein
MAQVKMLKIGSGSRPEEHTGSADDLTVLSLTTDTVSEQTGAAGVTVDGVILKDSGITVAADIVMADNSVTGIDTLTFTDVNGTIAGIQNQNLVDKSATEAITGAWDFGGGVLELPNSATPTVDATGEIALDTSIADHQPSVVFYDGSTTQQMISLLQSDLTSPTDGYVIGYNAASDKFELISNQQADEEAVNTDSYTNNEGSTINKGDVVYLSANNSVALADADTIAEADALVGIVYDASIADSASGLIHVSHNKIITNILTAATAGDLYYLSKTATTGNTLTTTAPSAGASIVKIGVAVNTTDMLYLPDFIGKTIA